MSTALAEPTQRKSLKYIHDDLVYYPHQIVGVRELARRNSFILADDMGLGKSIQALTVAAIDFEQGWAKRVLVVCPATLKGNWADEIDAHTHFTSTVLTGQPPQREAMLADFEASSDEILIVNYEQVKSHLEALNALAFDIVIFDEAHYIKSHKSDRTKAALGLRGKRFFLLTGSPMLNHVNELWSLLHRIDPIEYPNYWTFTHRYCVFGGYKDKQIVGVKHQAELVDRLHSVMLRRLKKDVLDLPAKTRVDIYVDAHPTQKKLIKQAKEELKIECAGKDPMELANPMVAFLRQWQILSTPANLDGQPDDSTKLDVAIEKIQEIVGNGRPVVIFTQFRPTLACLERRLMNPKKGIEPVDCRVLHGGVKQTDRVPTVTAWSEDAAAGRPQALLCMLQVGGVGLNMVAASEAIFVDELSVPDLNKQAEDRLDRIGQTLPVTIYRIRVRKSIEQRIMKLLDRKTDLGGQIVDTADWKRELVAALIEDDD